MRVVRTLVVSLSVFLAAACSDSPVPVEPQSDALAPTEISRSATSEDSVSWGGDDVIEITDDNGDLWRWEREGTYPVYPTIRLYKNGHFVGRFGLIYDEAADTLIADTLYDMQETGGWFYADGEGDLQDTSAGMPGDSEDMPKIESTLTSYSHPPTVTLAAYSPSRRVDYTGSIRTVDCSDLISAVLYSECQQEYDRMQDDAWEAAVTGGIGAFFVAHGNAIFGGAAVIGFGVKTADAVVSLGRWVQCKIA